MKKLILAAVLASTTLAGTAFANAPAMDVAAGHGQLGYSYNNLQTDVSALDLGTLHANGFQGAYGLSDKLAVTGDYFKTNSESFTVYGTSRYDLDNLGISATQFGLQYKLNNNFAVTAGNVNSELKYNGGSVSTNEIFAGVAYKAAIANNVNGYASYIRSSNIEDWKAGLTYDVGSNISVDAGYRHFETKDIGIKAEGVGFGVNYKF